MTSRREQKRARKHGDRLRREAWEALAAGEPQLAKKIIARALEEGPGNARYWKEQGDILAALGEARAAERSWEHALELSPEYADVLASLAAASEARGDARAALAYVERLAALAPEPALDERIERLRAAAGVVPRRPVYEASVEPRRTAGVDWSAIERALLEHGIARVDALVGESERAAFLAAARAASSLAAADVARTLGPRVEASDAPWHELLAELVPRLAATAAEGARTLGKSSGVEEHLPDRAPALRLWRIVAHESAELAVPVARPRFPFAIALVLAAEPADARAELELVDLRTGRKKHARTIDAGSGDALVACARERWVRVGVAHGLQPVRRVLRASTGAVDLLEATF